MKAILMGHVPPARTSSKSSWDETCWQKFALVQRQFRDMLVGSLFGHMNIDHFMLHDFKDLKKDTKRGRMANTQAQSSEVRESMLEDGEVTVASAADYLLDLGNAWAKLPAPPKPKKTSSSITEYIDTDEEDDFSIWQWAMRKTSISKKSRKGGKGDKGGKGGKKKKFLDEIGGRYGERFSVTHVSPSVVPNYFPTLRVFEYNITSLENTLLLPVHMPPLEHVEPPMAQLPISFMDFDDDDDWVKDVKAIVVMKKKKKENEARKKPRKYKFKVPSPPSKSAPPGPAYSPQTFTLKGYVQYFANLTHINNDFVAHPQSLDEEHDGSSVFGLEIENDEIEQKKWREGKHKNHQGKKPKNKPHPKKFKFEVEYNTTHDKLFGLKDLTVRSYVDLARRIGRDKKKKKVLSIDEEDEHDTEDELVLDQEEEGFEDDLQVSKRKDEKKKKHGKKHKHNKNGAWFTFIRRAFVGTMNPHEIEEVFCQHGVNEEEVREDNVMEL